VATSRTGSTNNHVYLLALQVPWTVHVDLWTAIPCAIQQLSAANSKTAGLHGTVPSPTSPATMCGCGHAGAGAGAGGGCAFTRGPRRAANWGVLARLAGLRRAQAYELYEQGANEHDERRRKGRVDFGCLPIPSLRTICRGVIAEPSVVYSTHLFFFCSDVTVVAISVAPALPTSLSPNIAGRIHSTYLGSGQASSG
jgi:hypothetical protein